MLDLDFLKLVFISFSFVPRDTKNSDSSRLNPLADPTGRVEKIWVEKRFFDLEKLKRLLIGWRDYNGRLSGSS